MKLLIDADSIVFKAGCANETRWYDVVVSEEGSEIVEPIGQFQYKKDAQELQEKSYIGTEIIPRKEAGELRNSLANAKLSIERIRDQAPDSVVYIQGEGNFRYDLYPEYKGHRSAIDRPIHEKEIREYLIKHQGAQLIHGEEVDDAVSWLHLQDWHSTAIAHIDKDIDNTPGTHYNYNSCEWYELSYEEADLNFARQLCTGDSTDNIPGLPGVGKATAAKILPEYTSDWKDVVLKEYLDRGFDEEYLVLQGRLLWMRREPNQMWDLST